MYSGLDFCNFFKHYPTNYTKYLDQLFISKQKTKKMLSSDASFHFRSDSPKPEKNDDDRQDPLLNTSSEQCDEKSGSSNEASFNVDTTSSEICDVSCGINSFNRHCNDDARHLSLDNISSAMPLNQFLSVNKFPRFPVSDVTHENTYPNYNTCDDVSSLSFGGFFTRPLQQRCFRKNSFQGSQRQNFARSNCANLARNFVAKRVDVEPPNRTMTSFKPSNCLEASALQTSGSLHGGSGSVESRRNVCGYVADLQEQMNAFWLILQCKSRSKEYWKVQVESLQDGEGLLLKQSEVLWQVLWKLKHLCLSFAWCFSLKIKLLWNFVVLCWSFLLHFQFLYFFKVDCFNCVLFI